MLLARPERPALPGRPEQQDRQVRQGRRDRLEQPGQPAPREYKVLLAQREPLAPLDCRALLERPGLPVFKERQAPRALRGFLVQMVRKA